jgi:molybdopterin converting factor small subunit
MPTVWIPSLLRPLTAGRETLEVAGATVGEVVADLDARFPGLRARLCDGDRLKPGITVAVDGQMARAGLAEPVGAASEVHFVPSISGGLALGQS